jgi:toxin ParE1/3/4
MRKLRYTSEALDNLADITAYIAVSSGIRTIGEGFVAQIREQCIRLASLPGTLGRDRSELGADLRSFAYKGYIIFFRYVVSTLKWLRCLRVIATSTATLAAMNPTDLPTRCSSTIYE